MAARKGRGEVAIFTAAVLHLAGACVGSDRGGTETADPGPLLLKARAYDENHPRWHSSPGFGSRVETRFASQDSADIVQYDDLGDSTFWTGQYVASQAFRFAVTGEEEARENAKRGVRALDAHLRATGKPGFVGRFAGPVASEPLWRYAAPCEGENCHVVTDGPYAGNFWLGNTSRDQYTGWFYGMSLFHDLVGDPELDSIVHEDIRAVVDRLKGDDWTIVDVDGLPTTAGPRPVLVMRLMYLAAAREILEDPAYDALFEEQAEFWTPYEKASAITWPNTYFQYFGISLGYLASYNLIRLEDDPERRAEHVATVDEMMYPPVANTHQVFFDYVWMAATGNRPPELLADARQSLIEFPDAPKRRVHPYHPPMPVDPFAIVANEIVKALGLDELIGDISPRSKDPYPMSQRCVVGDYWQGSPWALECGGDDPAFEFAGEDYLHAYWMGRYHGFLTAAD